MPIPELTTPSPERRAIWPGRFLVRADISYRDRRGKSSTLQVIHFQPDMTEKEAGDLLDLLGISPNTKELRNLVSQTRDTFSNEQAEALVAYLHKRRGTRAYAKPAYVPLPDQMGASAIPNLPSLRDRTVYKLYLEPGYDLDFRVEAVNIKVYINMAHLFREFKEHETPSNGIVSG